MFVGVGLVTAAVRHLQADPTLYLGLGAGGAVLFAIAAVLHEPRMRRSSPSRRSPASPARRCSWASGSDCSSAGSCTSPPSRTPARWLVPAGIVLSFVGYLLRSGRELLGRSLPPAVTLSASSSGWGIGLGVAAKRLDPPPVPSAQAGHGADASGGHGADAGHGEAAAKDAGSRRGGREGCGSRRGSREGCGSRRGSGREGHADHGRGCGQAGRRRPRGRGGPPRPRHAEAAGASHDAGTERRDRPR